MSEEISLKCNKDVQTPGSRRMFRSRRGKITLLNSVLDGFDPVELVDDLLLRSRGEQADHHDED